MARKKEAEEIKDKWLKITVTLGRRSDEESWRRRDQIEWWAEQLTRGNLSQLFQDIGDQDIKLERRKRPYKEA